MAWYAKLEAMKDGLKGKDGTSDTFMFAEQFAVDTDQTPAGTRLYVGNLSMNASEDDSKADDQIIIIGFEQAAEAFADIPLKVDEILL